MIDYSCRISNRSFGNTTFWSNSPIPSGPWRSLGTPLPSGGGDTKCCESVNGVENKSSDDADVDAGNCSFEEQCNGSVRSSLQDSLPPSLHNEIKSDLSTTVPSWCRESDETKSAQARNTFSRFTSKFISLKKRILNKLFRSPTPFAGSVSSTHVDCTHSQDSDIFPAVIVLEENTPSHSDEEHLQLPSWYFQDCN